MNERLCEYVDSRGETIRVDRAKGVIRGVKILGPISRNGRVYTTEAMREAVPLYEDVKVNINHPEGRPDRPRDYRDRIGTIRGVNFREGAGLYGDLHFNPKHALAEQLIWDAVFLPENVGFSHNVEAQTSGDGERLRVDRIVRVHSVDLVADPATTAGLFESASDQPSEVTQQEGDTTKTESTQASTDTNNDDTNDRFAELTEENESLRRKIRILARREMIERLLHEYRLPSADSTDRDDRAIIDDEFLQSMTEAKNERTIRRLIERRVRLIAAARRFDSLDEQQRPISCEQALETLAGRPAQDIRPDRREAIIRFVEAITS